MPTCEGSSPLTRGKHLIERTPPYRQGLIPTHAGKTPSIDVAVSFSGAHPHSRGEDALSAFATSSFVGSSPLTRGKLAIEAAGKNDSRLIPAHAGKTLFERLGRNQGRAHPRSRGENSLALREVSLVPGSSPLTRGKQCAQLVGH